MCRDNKNNLLIQMHVFQYRHCHPECANCIFSTHKYTTKSDSLVTLGMWTHKLTNMNVVFSTCFISISRTKAKTVMMP